MKRVWKYEIGPWDSGVLMPASAEVVSLGTQGEHLVVWALCDTSYPLVTRRFTVRGTGHDVPDEPGRFVGTAQMQTEEGELVWHVWEAA